MKVSKRIGDDANLVHSWLRAVSVGVNADNDVLLMKDNVNLNANTNAARIVDNDPDDPDHIYMQIFVYSDTRGPGEVVQDAFRGRDGSELFRDDLYRVNVRTGGEERIATGTYNTQDWILDGHGNIVARLNQTKLPLLDHLEVWHDGGWTEVGRYDATGDNGSGIVGLTEDGKSLVRLILNDSEMRTLTSSTWRPAPRPALYANPLYDVGSTIVDPLTDRVLGVAYDADKTEYHFFDAKWAALQKGLEAAFPGTSVTAVSWDTALDKLIVSVDAPRKPTTYYFLDRATHQATVIGSAYPELSEGDLAR